MAEPGAEATEVARDLDVEHAPIYALAYQESQRNLTQQAGVLDGIRTRAGLLITAANVVTAFLGAPAIKNAATPTTGSTVVPGLTLGGWLAIASFAIVGLCSIAILWPRVWIFRFGAKEIIDRVDQRPDETLPEMQRKLAVLNEASFVANEKKIQGLYWLFEGAAIAVFLEAGFWLMSLSQARVFGLQF